MKALFDTNILIDYLNGVPAAGKELELYEARSASIVTWMEVMCGGDAALDAATRSFLNRFTIIPIDSAIAERAVTLRRRQSRLKLADAIILATSMESGLMLVTRNTKDFTKALPGVRHTYVLQ